MHLGPVPIDYYCQDASHTHFRRTRVDRMVLSGALRWHGKHCRVAYWTEHRSWAKTPCHERDERAVIIASVATMQWVKGAR